MYRFIRENNGKKIAEKDIEAIEKKYNFSIPKVLKDFYLEYNDCKVYLCLFYVEEYEYEVLQFSSLKDMDETKELFDEFLPARFVPFAYDEGGDYFFWNSENGKVYMIRSDDIETHQLVCGSIEEFFEILENSQMEK